MRDKRIMQIISLTLSILLLSSQISLANTQQYHSNSKPGTMPATFTVSRNNYFLPVGRATKIRTKVSFDESDEEYQTTEHEGQKITTPESLQCSESELKSFSSIISAIAYSIGRLLQDPADGEAIAEYHYWIEKLIKLLDKQFRKAFRLLKKHLGKKEVGNGKYKN